MSDLHYCKPSKNDLFLVFIVSVVFSVLFSMMFLRFDSGSTIFETIIIFFIYLFILFLTRLVIMKFAGIRNAFELNLEWIYFDRFGFRSYDKLSYYKNKVEDNTVGLSIDVAHSIGKLKEINYSKVDNFKGIPVLFISVFFYILTLGFFIFPSVLKYNIKKIPHLFLGSKKRWEFSLLYFYNMDISGYRVSKVLFTGFLYYFVFGIFVKLFLGDSEFYYWFIFILYWFAFITLIPYPSSEGFQLFSYNKFAWLMVFTILVLGMIGLLVFNNLWYMFGVLIFGFIAVMFVTLWKKFMG